MLTVILLAIIFFLGALPSAYFFTRLFAGQDIRRVGSGNAGAMNTLRHAGLLPGVLTLLADVSKGALAVYLMSLFKSGAAWPLLAVLFVVAGHNFSPFLQFKGGKGIAPLLGALSCLSVYALLILFLSIGIIALRLRDVNTATGLGMALLPFILGILQREWSWFLVGAALAFVIIIKHVPDFEAHAARRD